MTFFDSHAHLESIEDDLDSIIARANAAGVTRIVTIGDDIPTSEWAGRAASGRDMVWSTAGMHPHNASAVTDDILARIEALAAHPRCVGVGETGLDYYYDKSPRDAQQRVFADQIAIAQRTGKTLVIHTRDAWDDTFRLLRKYSGRVVFHCFTGGPDEAARALEIGAYLSFSGILTFANAEPVRQAAAITPLDRVLIETDAPFLAPVPHRGRRNEPAFVVHTAEKLAAIKRAGIDEIAAATSANTEAAFAIS